MQLGRTVGAGKFLPSDRAYRLSAAPDGPDRIRLSWKIAPGYYLYRSSLKAQGTSFVRLGALAVPQGETKTDPYFGTQQIYRRELVAILPVERPGSAEPLSVPLRVTYRGCADAGLCYPPIHRTVTVSLPPGASTLGAGTAAGGSATAAPGAG
ncbi:MAG: protein-disulfide reductase DsbD N-terminal domain-containing protein, partial [Steroidobacteraceae bacterium]